jgi:hypothetical protein
MSLAKEDVEMKSIRAVAWLSLVLAVFGCEEEKPKPAAAAPSASVEAAPPAKAAEAPRPAPADLVLEPLLKDLKCEKKSTRDSCRVLEEFGQGSRWIAQTPAGEGRWIGNAFVRDKGVEKKQLVILWAKQVPTSQVGPGDLPVRVGTGTLADELIEHGFKMISALSHSDSPSKRNQARPAVEAFVPTAQRGAINTVGASVRLIAEDSVYLRQSGRKVLIVMPSQAPSASAGDGTYAEAWRATW